ncbi:MAG: flagellar biosynthesis repressor FlbT [Rhodospirillales bacterium]|nr:flagellar biosynthesis repressor FlbT [Rhodospirillales bacterium]
MALVIHLKKDGRVIVNGAVLENASGRTISLVVKNEAAILRDDDVLQPEEASTPASRIYFALQCAYLFQDHRPRHLAQFNELLASYLAAAPSAKSLGAAMLDAVAGGNLYDALKKARKLRQHEREILKIG